MAQSPTSSRDDGLELLRRIISLCEDAQRRRFNPFEVEVKEALEKIRRYLPRWRTFEEFCLDSEAVNGLSKVIRLQGDWIKYRASPVYVDSDLVKFKIKVLTTEQLAGLFLEAWRPILTIEQISTTKLREALEYWNLLPLLEDKSLKLREPQPASSEPLKVDELLRLGLLPSKEFNDILMAMWQELKEKAGGDGRISYWDFICAETYDETLARAYMTSFLVTYGYANLEVNPLEDSILIIPYERQKTPEPGQPSVSVTIPVNYEVWRRWKLGGERRQVG
ncbi:MAG: hypothetical protein QXJ75_04265 [Candidatus Bathyarchaeia archaeon]